MAIFPGSGGISRLPLLAGPAKAYELLYTGELNVRSSRLLDHLVGACEQHRRHLKRTALNRCRGT
jgi:enoyl-CoA hydratase/carnithine racemase